MDYNSNKLNSRVWKFTKEEMQKILDTSSSYQEVLDKVGLQKRNGNNIVSVKRRIEIENLSEEKLNFNRESSRKEQLKKLTKKSTIPDEQVFCIKSQIHKTSLRNRILKRKLIPYFCQICGNSGTHFEKPLTLQLDHINGVNDDNRLSNLRWLCPNCHSQTETYSNKGAKLPENFCSCGKKISRKSNQCFPFF